MNLKVIFFVLSLIFFWSEAEYILKLGTVQVDHFDPELVNVSVRFYFKARNVKALDMNLTFGEELINEEVVVNAKCFKWSVNQYKATVIQFAMEMKEFFEMPFLKKVLETSQPQMKMPPTPYVKYHLKGWTATAEFVPPNIPNGNYKLVQDFVHKQKSVMAIDWYFSFDNN